VLRQALEKRRSDQRLNFAYAELRRQAIDSSAGELAHFYERAFTPGDTNYQAQFWFARFAIELPDQSNIQKATSIFETLRKARVSQDMRIEIRDYFGGRENPTPVRGRLFRKGPSFGFFNVSELPLPVMVHENNVNREIWELLEQGEDARFFVCFCYSGLGARNIELV
jgi:hypothetical protein